MTDLISFLLHFDQYLSAAIQDYGALTYLILFAIIFIETGLVIAPFLPGDSLIFVSGAFAAAGVIDVSLLFAVFALAAISGDTVNYFAGKRIGMDALHKKIRYIKKEHVDETYRFYEKHGGKTIVLARFIPLIRTFAPFVAGLARMNYSRFVFYNISGGIAWAASFLALGYYFGNVPLIKDNLSLVILAIVAVSLIPAAIGLLKHRSKVDAT